jgi:hypothetical protein
MIAERKLLAENQTLGAATERMIKELQQIFPDARFLMQGKTYGPAEDVVVKIFVRDENRLNEVSDKAHELSLEYELETGYFIMPVTLPMSCSPVKWGV